MGVLERDGAARRPRAPLCRAQSRLRARVADERGMNVPVVTSHIISSSKRFWNSEFEAVLQCGSALSRTSTSYRNLRAACQHRPARQSPVRRGRIRSRHNSAKPAMLSKTQ